MDVTADVEHTDELLDELLVARVDGTAEPVEEEEDEDEDEDDVDEVATYRLSVLMERFRRSRRTRRGGSEPTAADISFWFAGVSERGSAAGVVSTIDSSVVLWETDSLRATESSVAERNRVGVTIAGEWTGATGLERAFVVSTVISREPEPGTIGSIVSISTEAPWSMLLAAAATE